jgi:mannose-6-phosphate isomerase-like protein (cupin superfamily)
MTGCAFGAYSRDRMSNKRQLREMRQMPKVSRESAAKVDDFGPAEDRHEDLAGYTTSFTTIRQDADLAPMLKGLPDDRCQCPHWGYVFKGRLTWRFADREEVCEAGDAFYVPPGHTPAAEAGSEFLQISPAGELREVTAAVMKNMQAMHGA